MARTAVGYGAMVAAEDPDADAVRHLEAELRRHPEHRYPVQHATAAFHLASVHLGEGRAGSAVEPLRTAVQLFDGLPVEQAKALNMLGVAHRTLGATCDAEEAFAQAARGFRACDQPLEEAAATYNLGLVALDRADRASAVASFRHARGRFSDGGAPAQASAAGRELGAALLTSDEPEEALEVLEVAMADAQRAGDLAALGAAANVAGLARLALDQPAEAVEAFRSAAGAHPRGVRAEGYAMAKANLGLAHERLGDAPRARLAARQARDTPGAPSAALAQATALLSRLAEADDDLLVLFDDEPEDRWSGVLREELVRWVDTSTQEQQALAAGLVRGQLERRERSTELSAAWLGVLLELPADSMLVLVDRIVEALESHDPEERRRFRNQVARGMATFHVPQLLRLRDVFQTASDRRGDEGSWN
jgi:tetratricopeptide (TPR) repeat protein